LLVDFLEMSALAILIPILVATADADAIVSGGVPKGLPVGIDSVGDLRELVQHGVPAAAFGVGTAVVGGGRGEAAIGGYDGNERSKGVRCSGNGTASFCVGKVSVGAEIEEEAMRERIKEWICVLLKKKEIGNILCVLKM